MRFGPSLNRHRKEEMADENNTSMDPEIEAISAVYNALKSLDSDAQKRVVGFVAAKIGILLPTLKRDAALDSTPIRREQESALKEGAEPETEQDSEESDELPGISPVAKRWMARNGLEERGLSELFSLGVDEIDLIAKKVPGDTKKDRMHNVFLLKGVASYLGSGAFKFTHEQVKEACLHYNAFDAGNFASYMKTLSGDISGTKESGYALTARGQNSATELVKKLTQKADGK